MFFVRAVSIFALVLFFALLAFGGYFWLATSASKIDETIDVNIARGSSLNVAAKTLKEAGVIRSAVVFQSLVLMQGGERDIVAGIYRFSEPETAKRIAERLRQGEFNTNSLGVTFPEGTTVKEMGKLLVNKFEGFNEKEFIEIATPLEGFLFPDTYFFHSDVTPEEVVEIMQKTFADRISSVTLSDEVRDKPLDDIINMAAILEEEARDLESRQIVAGILWARLKAGIPLQVDAAFLYIDELEGRNTYTLTKEDLAIDSPYNTYRNTGLPPTPITNPGLESIMASANPISSDYFFYLSDTKGNMYYAKTFEEHIKNRVFLDY